MKKIKQEVLSGERALFQSRDVKIEDCVFADGESPLKESRGVAIEGSIFKWKYPLWYCEDVNLVNTTLLETARSGIWYTNHIRIEDSVIEAPKTFRRGSDIYLRNVTMPNALESFWNCQDIQLDNVQAKGDYFAMNCENITIDGLKLTGNYSFDGAKNIEVRNSVLISKDAFWNCENVTVYDSIIIGEYLGWNAKNITFINCTIESLQGLCYMEHLKMVNCKLLHTTLAFEYSSVDAQITTPIDSVMNPTSGRIVAPRIDEVILEKDKVDPNATQIIVAQELPKEKGHSYVYECQS